MLHVEWRACSCCVALPLLHLHPPVRGQDAAAGGAAGAQKYTMAEYNAYQAAAAEKNPAAQLKLLDDFVAKYPEFRPSKLHLFAVLQELWWAEKFSQDH